MVDECSRQGSPKPGGSGVDYGAKLAWISWTLLATAIALRIASLFVPVFDWDEYTFALAGRAIAEGDWLVRNVFDNKPVGLYYLFAGSQQILGQTVLSARMPAVISCLLTLWVLRATYRREAGPAGHALIAALYLLMVFYLDGWASMSELLTHPLLALSTAIARKPAPTKFDRLAFGALFGACFQISYLTLPIFGTVALAWIAASARLRPAPVAMAGSLCGIGFAITACAFWLPQLAGGTLGNLIADQVLYHENYKSDYLELLDAVVNTLYCAVPVVLVLLARPVRASAWRDRALLINCAGLIGATVAFFASGRFYFHYFLLGVPYLAGAAFCLYDPHSKRWHIATVLMATAALGVATYTLAEHTLFRNRHTGRSPMALAGHGLSGLDVEIARYLARNTRAQDRILVFNESPTIYYLADRRLATRYVFPTHYLRSNLNSWVAIEPEALLEQAIRSKVAMIVVGNIIETKPNVEPILRAAGYRQVRRFVDGRREAEVYRYAEPDSSPPAVPQ